jgi:5'-phosphate synthase pdxT subunit
LSEAETLNVGVLNLQGDVSEHVEALHKAMEKLNLQGDVLLVKKPTQLDSVHGLIIPGGESTVIGRIADKTGLIGRIREVASAGMTILGTCAGMVLLSKEVYDLKVGQVNQPLLKLMDVRVIRNAFGRQRESFEAHLSIPKIGEEPFPAVFIRAPVVERALSPKIEVLARYEGKIVAVQQGNLLATSFHPELVDDLRLYDYFLDLVLRRSQPK